MLRVRVSTASAEIIETELITAGRRGLQCSFEFNSAWDGLAKTVIVNGVVKRDVVLVGDAVTVPGECLIKEQFPLRIGVYGADGSGNIVIPTIWANFGKIQPSARPSNNTPDAVLPDVVAQIQINSSNALEMAQEVMRRADSGEFDGADGATGPRGEKGDKGDKGDPGEGGEVRYNFTVRETDGELVIVSSPSVSDVIADALANNDKNRSALLVFENQSRVIDLPLVDVRYSQDGVLIPFIDFAAINEENGVVTYLHGFGRMWGLTKKSPSTEAASQALDAALDAVDELNTTLSEYIDAKYTKPDNGIPKTDLASDVQTSLGKADTALQSYTETDPTVPSWAKAANKPSYTASEVGALPASTAIPSKTSDLTNDSGFLTSYTETDPTVPAWAKASTKPSYTASEVGAAPAVTEVTVSTAGAVTQALDAGKLYHFTGALTALTITLNAAASGQLAQYHFDFNCGSTAPTVTIPNTVSMPDGNSFDASTHYEVDILNNYGAVISWPIS